MQLVSFPWYDIPETHDAIDALWSSIACKLIEAGVEDVPETLSRDLDCRSTWRSPQLMLTQCCGYDLVTDYQKDLRLVATPCYTAPGCAGPQYSSIIVVPESRAQRKLGTFQGSTCAVNEMMSHSGMNILRNMVAPLAQNGLFFSNVKITGSHLDSLTLVAEGHADLAAIDCVTYALIEKHCPHKLRGVVPLCTTPMAPAPPFVTRADADPSLVFTLNDAISRTFQDETTRLAREALLLSGAIQLPLSAYNQILEFEYDAQRIGYPQLR